MTLRWSLLVVSFLAVSPTMLGIGGCRNERPEECQRFRQCCAEAQSANGELETIRVTCARKDDNDAVICRRRLEEVVTQLPSLSDSPACRLPPPPQ